jgi:hypothetical protein
MCIPVQFYTWLSGISWSTRLWNELGKISLLTFLVYYNVYRDCFASMLIFNYFLYFDKNVMGKNIVCCLAPPLVTTPSFTRATNCINIHD